MELRYIYTGPAPPPKGSGHAAPSLPPMTSARAPLGPGGGRGMVLEGQLPERAPTRRTTRPSWAAHHCSQRARTVVETRASASERAIGAAGRRSAAEPQREEPSPGGRRLAAPPPTAAAALGVLGAAAERTAEEVLRRSRPRAATREPLGVTPGKSYLPVRREQALSSRWVAHARRAHAARKVVLRFAVGASAGPPYA